MLCLHPSLNYRTIVNLNEPNQKVLVSSSKIQYKIYLQQKQQLLSSKPETKVNHHYLSNIFTPVVGIDNDNF